MELGELETRLKGVVVADSPESAADVHEMVDRFSYMLPEKVPRRDGALGRLAAILVGGSIALPRVTDNIPVERCYPEGRAALGDRTWEATLALVEGVWRAFGSFPSGSLPGMR